MAFESWWLGKVFAGNRVRRLRQYRGHTGPGIWSLLRSAIRLQIFFLRRTLGHRHFELHATIIVCLNRGGDVEVGQWNLLDPVIQNVNCLAHDGVIADLLLVAISKD